MKRQSQRAQLCAVQHGGQKFGSACRACLARLLHDALRMIESGDSRRWLVGTGPGPHLFVCMYVWMMHEKTHKSG